MYDTAPFFKEFVIMLKDKNKKKCVIFSIITVLILSIVCVLIITQCTDIFEKDNTKNEDHYIKLDHGIKITLLGSYDGMFMEDGSNDDLKNILSIVVLNTNEKDLQYAEIYLKYEDYTAEFTVSNLPSGESALLLEKKRTQSKGEKPNVYVMENEVFFQSKMDDKNDTIEVSGVVGIANIKNTSDKDIVGDIVIYYKNYSNDMFYGGITYRITIPNGLKAGELKQVSAAHYSPAKSKIVSVNIIEK